MRKDDPVNNDSVANASTRQLLFLGLLALAQTGISSGREFVLELFDTTGRVDELQLAGVEGMASVADINLQFFAYAARDKRVAATAGNFGLMILGMDVCFHGRLLGEIMTPSNDL
jgi:hypothetical protein